MESNSTAWLNVYLAKTPETIEDLLVAFNEEKVLTFLHSVFLIYSSTSRFSWMKKILCFQIKYGFFIYDFIFKYVLLKLFYMKSKSMSPTQFQLDCLIDYGCYSNVARQLFSLWK